MTCSVNAHSLLLIMTILTHIRFLFVAVSFHAVRSREDEFLVRFQAHPVADGHTALGKHPVQARVVHKFNEGHFQTIISRLELNWIDKIIIKSNYAAFNTARELLPLRDLGLGRIIPFLV